MQRATRVFWDRGFAGTSTDTLAREMGIGRQSLYNTFGDKRTLYLEVLRTYQEGTVAGHVARLEGPSSPLEGIRELLGGLAVPDDAVRALGCLGVNSVEEFGTRDSELSSVAGQTNRILGSRLVTRIREGQALGEIHGELGAEQSAGLVLLTMTGLQVSARAGADAESMRSLADFMVERLRAS